MNKIIMEKDEEDDATLSIDKGKNLLQILKYSNFIIEKTVKLRLNPIKISKTRKKK